MRDCHNSLSTAKITHSGSIDTDVGDKKIQFAISSCQGRRQTQEDAYAIEVELRPFDDVTGNFSPGLQRTLPNHALFAVFDGHGTDFASKYTARHFIPTFCKQSSFLEYSRKFLSDIEQQQHNRARKMKGQSNKDFNYNSHDENDGVLRLLISDAIKSTMIELDANMLLEMTERNHAQCEAKSDNFSRDDHADVYDVFDSGTTAIVVVLTPQYIVCANLGDSRAILQRSSASGTSVISLSNDHKPTNCDEVLRIENAGGKVIRGLIEGRLAVSRGLGDFSFKHTPSIIRTHQNTECCSSNIDYHILLENQMVTSVPEITFQNRATTFDNFIAIASDGIWDILSNEKCAEMISTIYNEGEQSTALVCEEVLDQCYARGSLDNMTLILIKLPVQNIGAGGGVMKRRKQRLRSS